MPSSFDRREGSSFTGQSSTISAQYRGTGYIQASQAKTQTKQNYLQLQKGDMVLHTAFGKGMVLSVLKMSSDALLEIAFDDVGTKKLMAKTASAHMKKLEHHILP
mgnify:CR=1 FL=1